MNKKILSKLKMQNPEYFDSTDSNVAVVPRSVLEKYLMRSLRIGLLTGSLFGSLGLSLSSLLALITATDFNNFLNIDGFTWRAIFILMFIIFGLIALSLLIIIGVKYWNGDFNEQKIVEIFFEENKRVKTKGRQQQKQINGSSKNN